MGHYRELYSNKLTKEQALGGGGLFLVFHCQSLKNLALVQAQFTPTVDKELQNQQDARGET